jgi:DNA-binding CsgD family transcriptional regulator
MIEEKCIIVGCDDANLSAILDSIKNTSLYRYNIISVTRHFDLTRITSSINPDLIILCFQNNQSVLKECTALASMRIPVLCLTRKFENETLCWDNTNIVFTYPIEHIKNQGYLISRVNSIFLLKPAVIKSATEGTLANAAIQQHHAGSKNLSRYVLELDQKIEVLTKVKDRIASLYPKVDNLVRAELTSIVNSIKACANDNKMWDDFKLYFEETNPSFLVLLANKYPSLTPIDLKYCCYLKMNMANDDIRNLLGINQESVRTHKYRLKKKMSLSKDQDLAIFLKSVEKEEYQLY